MFGRPRSNVNFDDIELTFFFQLRFFLQEVKQHDHGA